MTSITIKDLPESVDLDRDAMNAISGGARVGGGQYFRAPAASRSKRIIDYPGSIAGNFAAPAAGRRPSGNKPLK